MAKPRKCRDEMCMVLFVLCWIVWLLLVWTTITDGCPDKYVSVSVPFVSFLYVSLYSVCPSFVSTPVCLSVLCMSLVRLLPISS